MLRNERKHERRQRNRLRELCLGHVDFRRPLARLQIGQLRTGGCELMRGLLQGSRFVDGLERKERRVGRHGLSPLDPELCERAKLLAWHIVSRARNRGGYVLGLPSVGQLKCCGLFQGLAGIGYTLLRLARPDLLPELLLLR